jgi:hypothetical protein
MPPTVACPWCGAKVKTATAPGGRSQVTCPNCRGRFVTDSEGEKVEQPDDAPSSRSSRDEKDGRPRRKKKAAGSSRRGKGVWVALTLGSALLLGGGAVMALVLLGGGGSGGGRGRSGDRGHIPPAMLAYLPNDTFRISYANVKNQLRAFANDKGQVRVPHPLTVAQLEKDYGPLDNVEEALWAIRSGDFTRGGTLVVVRFARPVDKAKLTAGGKELVAKGKKYYELKANKNRPGFGGTAFGDYVHFPSDTMVVRTVTDVLAREVVGGDAGKFPDWYRRLIDEGDGYVIDVLRAPREGEVISAAGAVGRLECKSKSGNGVAIRTVEEYVTEEAALQGRKFWDELATTRKLPDEDISFRVSGKRILVEVSTARW